MASCDGPVPLQPIDAALAECRWQVRQVYADSSTAGDRTGEVAPAESGACQPGLSRANGLARSRW
jgi:hypothetical protein